MQELFFTLHTHTFLWSCSIWSKICRTAWIEIIFIEFLRFASYKCQIKLLTKILTPALSRVVLYCPFFFFFLLISLITNKPLRVRFWLPRFSWLVSFWRIMNPRDPSILMIISGFMGTWSDIDVWGKGGGVTREDEHIQFWAPAVRIASSTAFGL